MKPPLSDDTVDTLSRSQRRWLIAAALAAVLITAFYAWPLLRHESAPPPAAASARNELIATAPGWVDAQGGIQRLGVRVEGTVDSVPVHEGDAVSAGATLIQLDDRVGALEVQQAQLDTERRQQEQAALALQIERAHEQVTRLRPLVEQQAEPEDELRAAVAHEADLNSQKSLGEIGLRAAQLNLQLLHERQLRLQLRAPADGEVLRLLTHPGEAVAPGTPLLWFVAKGPRIVRAELDERLFGKVSAGMHAEVTPEYDDTLSYEARVLRVARAVGPVQSLPELRGSAKDDRVVECVLSVETNDLLIGQRVLVRVLGDR